MAMKQAEMGTELVDHLTPEERVLLSRLNPEIAKLKEKLITRKTNRMEVSKMHFNVLFPFFFFFTMCWP